MGLAINNNTTVDVSSYGGDATAIVNQTIAQKGPW